MIFTVETTRFRLTVRIGREFDRFVTHKPVTPPAPEVIERHAGSFDPAPRPDEDRGLDTLAQQQFGFAPTDRTPPT